MRDGMNIKRKEKRRVDFAVLVECCGETVAVGISDPPIEEAWAERSLSSRSRWSGEVAGIECGPAEDDEEASVVDIFRIFCSFLCYSKSS